MLARSVRIQLWLGSLRRRALEEQGASAVEYGLLLALIAAVIIAVVRVLGQHVSNDFQSATVGWP
jgi:pilus assembly protein Flp/PilA